FNNDDQILAVLKDGNFYTTNYDLSNRYQGEILKVEKLDTQKTYSAIYFDGESETYYIKRFSFEPSSNAASLFISDAPGSRFVELTCDAYPQVMIKFGGKHSKRPDEVIDVEQFIGKKGFKAKGKRATTFEVSSISFIEPLEKEPQEDVQDKEMQSGMPETDTYIGDNDDNPTLF
ncbi:MAG: DNA gyrase/topoisomerase IV subunit A, partial [Bacteroidales bacterium]|nr:DNA gyrase/topoisomerase IV subunit A [Bacteroidales bacterium]